MKNFLLPMAVLVLLFPGVILAQENRCEALRAELEQIRQEKDQAMDHISLDRPAPANALP